MNIESIQNVAVLGLGTIGHGVAQLFALAGYPVRCWDEQQSARDTLKTRIETNLRQLIASKMIEADSIEPTLQRLIVCESEAESLEDADYVSEAIREDLATKQAFFSRIETAVSTETILTSNTSTFPMSQMGENLKHPERALVTHPFNPPYIVPVVEVVPSSKTSVEVVDVTVEILKRIGKLPIRLKQEIPGFLVNRVQIAMVREIWSLLDQGVASAEDIDRAIQGSLGFRLAASGPLEICDFGGLDIWSRVYQNLTPEICSDTELPPAINRLVDAGHYGPKSGQGIYEYTPSGVEKKLAERDRRYLALSRMLYGNSEEA